MSQTRVTLIMSFDKACALLSALHVSLPNVHREIIDSSYDPDAVQLYGHLNSIYDDILIQIAKSGRNGECDV